MAKSKSVSKKTSQQNAVGHWLKDESNQSRLYNLLKGSYLDPQEFVDNITLAFSTNPDIAECDNVSKFEVALELASLNLTPNWDHVALIPRKTRSGVPRLTYMIQYQGIKSLIDRSELVKGTSVVLIHKNDAGKYRFDPALRQIKWSDDFDPFDEDREFNTLDDVRGGYLIVEFTDDRPDKHILVPRNVFVRARAAAETKNVWDRWLPEQCHKTVYHYAFNRREVPVDAKVAGLMTRAIQQDYEMIGADPNRVASNPPKRVGTSLNEFDEGDPIDASFEVIEKKPEPKQEPKPKRKKVAGPPPAKENPMEKPKPKPEPVHKPEPEPEELYDAPDEDEIELSVPQPNEEGKFELTDENWEAFRIGANKCESLEELLEFDAQFFCNDDQLNNCAAELIADLRMVFEE